MARNLTSVALLGAIATLFFTGPAWAYLDPGTGSMMLQLLLGGVAGAMVVGKLYWQRLREYRDVAVLGQAQRGRAGDARERLFKSRPA